MSIKPLLLIVSMDDLQFFVVEMREFEEVIKYEAANYGRRRERGVSFIAMCAERDKVRGFDRTHLLLAFHVRERRGKK